MPAIFLNAFVLERNLQYFNRWASHDTCMSCSSSKIYFFSYKRAGFSAVVNNYIKKRNYGIMLIFIILIWTCKIKYQSKLSCECYLRPSETNLIQNVSLKASYRYVFRKLSPIFKKHLSFTVPWGSCLWR